MASPITEKIDEFLTGRMNPPEQEAFLKELTGDPALRRQVANRQSMLKGIDAYGDEVLRSRLRAIHREVTARRRGRWPLRRRYVVLYLLAAIVLAFLFWMGIRSLSPKTEAEKLYAESFEPYPLSIRTRDEPVEGRLDKALAAYDKRAYAEALAHFESLPATANDDPQLQLARGICLLDLGRPADARQLFEAILRSDQVLYHDEARWYHALARLREGQTDEARRELQYLARDPSADHHAGAVRLIEEIDRLSR